MAKRKYNKQLFLDTPGRVSYFDRVHKDGNSEDENGNRLKVGAWRVRRGLSQVAAPTDLSVNITSSTGFRGKDGRLFVLVVQGPKWIQFEAPDLVWGN